MAKDLLAIVKFASLDPLVDDPSVSLKFHSDDAADFTSVTAVSAAIATFFNGIVSGHAPCDYISMVINRNASACTNEFYDITGHLGESAKHGAPVAMTHWTLFPVTGTPQGLPAEVSATVSYRADYGTDVEFAPGTRPRSRDRNRFYMPPLNVTAITDDSSTHRTKLNGTFITTLLTNMQTLSNTIVSGGVHWNLRVWSRMDAALKLPTTAWMDDDPDTQRRRSDPSPGSRTYVALSSV